VQLIFLSACGGGSGSGNLTPGITVSVQNVAAVTVDQGPAQGGGSFNTPYVSVQICAPGSTTNCETIDHVEVDTGSFGLRILSSAITSPTLLTALPSATVSVSSVPIVECTMFADGFSWGSVRRADAHIAGENASNIPIQIIGDPAFPNIPQACQNTGMEEDSVSTFGANGIIGVGLFVRDCIDCDTSTESGAYYACPSNGAVCTTTVVATNQIVSNPVASFATDNNGVILSMNTVPDGGAQQGSGSLIFGIDTQSNNMLGSATVLTTDNVQGFITVDFQGVKYPESFIDSGSNLFFLTATNPPITTCSIQNQQFYCPAAEQSLTAINVGLNSVQSTVNFNVANARTQFNNTTFTAFDNVAAPNPSTLNGGFDFGMPFFYGRKVFTAISGKNTSGGPGPFFAY
jgi:hypothetical protein